MLLDEARYILCELRPKVFLDILLVSHPLLTTKMLAASRLSVRVARRAVIVGGQRQAAVSAVRRRDIRGLQSVAQTDRVSPCPYLRKPNPEALLPPPSLPQDTITRLLYSIGTKREVERHLRIFSSASHPSSPAKFAVIKVGGAVLEQLDELALSLSFLYRVGLYPVILHGAGPQLNDIIEREGIVPDYIDGIRVTGEQCVVLLLAHYVSSYHM